MTFNKHICGFSCHKRKKTILVKSTEVHGILDGIKESEEIDHTINNFNYSQFPRRETMFVPGMDDSLDEEEILKRKNNFRKI